MKSLRFKIATAFALLFITGSLCFESQAQVTIGMESSPAKGALLQLKNKEVANPTSVTDATNATVDKDGGGLGLPRVMLVNKTTLEPFVMADASWTTNTGKVKEKHAGLVVYNIYVSPTTETDANKTFQQGLYVWNGATWSLVGEGMASEQKYFYMPSCNIKLTSTGTDKLYDLYAQYETQFTNNTAVNPLFVTSNDQIKRVPSPSNASLYAKTELDYVITYYDKSVIDNVKIDGNGVMTYDVISLDVTSNSFLNVIFIVK